MVRQDDRRRQHGAARPARPTSTGQVPMFSQRSAAARRSREDRSATPARRPRSAGSCGWSRRSLSAPPRVVLRERARVRDLARDAARSGVDRLGRPVDARQRAPSCATGCRGRRRRRAAPRPPRRPSPNSTRSRSPPSRAPVDLALGRLVPGDVALAVDDQLVDGSRPLAVSRATRRSTTCRNRTRTSSLGPPSPSRRHCVCITHGSSGCAAVCAFG